MNYQERAKRILQRIDELASFSGAESMNIARLLMSIDQPSQRVIDAVVAAMTWMDQHKLTGIKVVNLAGADGIGRCFICLWQYGNHRQRGRRQAGRFS